MATTLGGKPGTSVGTRLSMERKGPSYAICMHFTAPKAVKKHVCHVLADTATTSEASPIMLVGFTVLAGHIEGSQHDP